MKHLNASKDFDTEPARGQTSWFLSRIMEIFKRGLQRQRPSWAFLVERRPPWHSDSWSPLSMMALRLKAFSRSAIIESGDQESECQGGRRSTRKAQLGLCRCNPRLNISMIRERNQLVWPRAGSVSKSFEALRCFMDLLDLFSRNFEFFIRFLFRLFGRNPPRDRATT